MHLREDDALAVMIVIERVRLINAAAAASILVVAASGLGAPAPFANN